MTDTSFDVRVWGIQVRQRGGRTNYRLQWTVGGVRHSKSFKTRALADSFRSDLLVATRRGESFDTGSGLPTALRPQPAGAPDWITHAGAFIDSAWDRLAPRSRQSIADALCTITWGLLPDEVGRPTPKEARAVLDAWAYNRSARTAAGPPTHEQEHLEWMRRHVPTVDALANQVLLRRLLDSITKNMTGQPAAPTTISRRRAVLYSVLRHAVEAGHLNHNPLDRLRWRSPKVSTAVDSRAVVNHEQAQRLLASVAAQQPRGEHLVAFFACMYCAALRPSEAVSLCRSNVSLPRSDAEWGELHLTDSNPFVPSRWTDTGGRAPRQLKHRSVQDVRDVPMPPQLVQLLRRHLRDHGAAPDGRLFSGARGGPVPGATYLRIWRLARAAGLTPAEAVSPLAQRPYDLRHAAVSTWLSAGVDATLVAEWAGHSVAVLLRVYAKTVVGRDEVARDRVTRALSLHEQAVVPLEDSGDDFGQRMGNGQP